MKSIQYNCPICGEVCIPHPGGVYVDRTDRRLYTMDGLPAPCPLCGSGDMIEEAMRYACKDTRTGSFGSHV